MSNDLVQVILFKVKPDFSAADFKRAASQSHSFVQQLDGFISRELLHAEETEQWVDIVHWASLEAEERAAEAINASSDCLEFISMIDDREIQMMNLVEVNITESAVRS